MCWPPDRAFGSNETVPFDQALRERYAQAITDLGAPGAAAGRDFDPAAFDASADVLACLDDLVLPAMVGIVDHPGPMRQPRRTGERLRNASRPVRVVGRLASTTRPSPGTHGRHRGAGRRGRPPAGSGSGAFVTVVRRCHGVPKRGSRKRSRPIQPALRQGTSSRPTMMNAGLTPAEPENTKLKFRITPRNAGDKGYSFPSLRRSLRRRGIRAVIPAKADQPRRPSFDEAAYRERNRVERPINRLKQWRRVATRYDKREANHLAMVTIAAIVLLWLE